MAHKKGVGSSKNGRESESKRLGTKVFDGQDISAGSIVIRQRGTKIHPGEFVGIGRDPSIYSLIKGTVEIKKKKSDRTCVSVKPN